MGDAKPTPRIYVLAGPNGAGKSSILGAAVAKEQLRFFNPDEVAKRIRQERPELTNEQANSDAWREGKRLLEKAVGRGLDFAFETTMGGDSISELLERCLDDGGEVHIWYVCLASPEQHVQRVRARAAAGGHDIPEKLIRSRYHASRLNLIRLLPKLTDLWVYDNSAEADLKRGAAQPEFILHMADGRLDGVCELAAVPGWAKPIVQAALGAHASLSA
jgi:predicted ABC-type ATPase